MKRFIFLLTSLLLTTFLSGQQLIANEYPAWDQPVIKRLMAKDPTVTGYGIKDSSRFINIAILDRKSKILYWISCEGFIIEASQLTDIDYGFLVSKKVDPFQLHQLLYKKDLQITDDAIAKLRFPKNKFYSSADPHYDQYLTQLIKAKRFDTLKTPVQKMAAFYKDEQNYLYHLNYALVGHPLKIKPDSIYGAMLLQAGKGIIEVTQHTDSTGTACFYNKGSLSPVYKAILNIQSATLYFYQTDQSVFDSIPINRKQILKLIDEGTNVFTLYQNYTLWQLSMLDNSVKQLHDYCTNTKTALQEKKEVQYLLAGFGGDKEALIGKLKQLEGERLLKLEKLFDVDKNYLDEGLRTSFKYSTVPVRYGEYIEGKGLVISDPVPPYSPPVVSSQTRGNKLYELTDQRGNVMVVISDKKVQHDDNGDKIVDYNTADVVNATDYSSFGKPLPGRTIEMRDYKYGYNGKENDAETGYQNYGFRMYDPNIARFISEDPITAKYPELTPYQFSSNSPIAGIDRDGLELENFMSKFKKPGELKIKLPNEQTAQIQHYSIAIQQPNVSFDNFKTQFKKTPQDFLSNSKATFNAPVDANGNPAQFKEGNFIKIDIIGPMNDGYVLIKSIKEDEKGALSATFVTLEGHVEKGIITFTLSKDKNGNTKFEINSKSNVDYGSVPTGFAREQQKESWKLVLNNVAKKIGGKVVEKKIEIVNPIIQPLKENIKDKTYVKPS